MRYKKDYRFDGWPVLDTKTKSILSKDEVIKKLNEQEKTLNELRELMNDMANNAVFKCLIETTSRITNHE